MNQGDKTIEFENEIGYTKLKDENITFDETYF